MIQPILSICIPTYNRFDYLKECLDSILVQYNNNIEVVISDNASSDNTTQLIDEYKEKLNIIFHRFDANQGFDENCTKVVSMASGKYCMILGSDDCLLPGAVCELINILNHGEADVLHVGYRQCGLSMDDIRHEVKLENKKCIINGPRDVADYIKVLPNLSLSFAFISSFIFLKSAWPVRREYEKWIGSLYVHLFCMHSIISKGCRIISSDNIYVAARGGNVNAVNDQPGKLLSLDLISFKKVVTDIYYNDADIHNSMSCVFKKSYPDRSLLYMYSYGGYDRIMSREKELKYFGYNKRHFLLLKLLNGLNIRLFLKKMIETRSKIKEILK